MICISIGTNDYDLCCQIVDKYDFAEIRLDLCNFSKLQYQNLFSKNKRLLTTYINDILVLNSEEYYQLFDVIKFGTKIIDINYNWDKEVKENLIDFAKENEVEIICSYHNFELTPNKDKLFEVIENINKYEVDFIKIATKANSFNDAARLISLYDSSYKNLIVVGMGQIGRIVRIASLKLGAPFTFASYSDDYKTANSQINYKDLSNLVDMI